MTSRCAPHLQQPSKSQQKRNRSQRHSNISQDGLMKQPIFSRLCSTARRLRRMQNIGTLIAIGAVVTSQPGCSTLTPTQRGALLVGAETLANIAGTAAATYYGGPAAGQLASAGLSALGSVLQGYVGATVPTAVVQATPGVGNVGEAVAGVIAPNHTVSQGDVNIVNQAAKIASALNLTTPAISGSAAANP